MSVEYLTLAAPPRFTQAQHARLVAEVAALYPGDVAHAHDETAAAAERRWTREARNLARRKTKPANALDLLHGVEREPWTVYEWTRRAGGIATTVRLGCPRIARVMTDVTTREACDAVALIRGEAPAAVLARVVEGVTP